MYNDFLLANLSCQFFRQFWLARVGNLTNEADVEQNSFMVNFSDNSDVRQGFKASLRDFWNRDISRRTAESHRYVFGR